VKRPLLPLMVKLAHTDVQAVYKPRDQSMGERQLSRSSVTQEIVISLSFVGRWLARHSPARRVPSHGTDLLGGGHAIDFIGVDHRHRTADRRDWRTFHSTEPVERFFA
jgi:hypothetical protein